MLTDEDLAYMRRTQAEEARPTPAELVKVTQVTTPSGGRTNQRAEPVPIMVRLDGREKDAPPQVTALVGTGKAVKVVMDLLEVRAGDFILVNGGEFQVVADPVPDTWTTALVVWTKQTKAPPRG